MLIEPRSKVGARRARSQRGVVLLFALILLVALTLAGIALTRSVSTTNIIAGNMAFQQAATHSADVGIETAIAWLEANNTGTALHTSVLSGMAVRYAAQREDPAVGDSWDEFWSGTLAGNGSVNTIAPDGAGNTVSYVIHRLCNATGAPTAADCAESPIVAPSSGDSKGQGVLSLTPGAKQTYYRVTTRVTGPRNTVSYVQAVVAM